ncbi:MAG: hypothetical protein OXC14_04125 [Rhodospirillaceae bacterium]|nr:hypothetical protein [Rhodospirillaceae bacterium]
MKLDDYLVENGIPRVRFAEQIGVGPAYITALCNGEFWSRNQIMRRIVDATDGAVGMWDFLGQDTKGAAGVSPDKVSGPQS